MRYPGFINGSVKSQSLIADGEQTMNWYLEEIRAPGASSQVALYPTPGFSAYIVAPQITHIGTRAGIEVNGRAFVVVATGFYELFATQTATLRGTIIQDNNLAQIVYNGPTGDQLLISSGGNAYNYNLTTNTLTLVLTAEAHQIGMLDGYFLALNQTTGKLRISAVNDGLTWDSTQFALRSDQPDPWKGMVVNAPDIWLLGSKTGSVWYDSGAAPFPLAARQGLTVPFGTGAPFSFAFVSGVGYWLATNRDGTGTIVSTRGYAPQKISSFEVDTALATYRRDTSITDAEALVYEAEGHTFFILRFPRAQATWAYDTTTGSWAERGKWNAALNGYDVWAPRVFLSAFGKSLVGNATTGTIATMEVTLGSEADGSVIRRLRRGPVLVNENRRGPLHNFELLFEAGVGLATGQGSDPQFMFRGSSDGGKTWGNERLMSIGKIGQYHPRAYVTRLGSPRLWVPEVSVSDPVPTRIVDAFVNNLWQGQ